MGVAPIGQENQLISDEMIEKTLENFRLGREVHQRYIDAGLTKETFEEALTRIICWDQ